MAFGLIHCNWQLREKGARLFSMLANLTDVFRKVNAKSDPVVRTVKPPVTCKHCHQVGLSFLFLPQEDAVVACSSINDIWFFFIVLNSDVFTSVEDSSKTSVKNMHRVFAIIHTF